MFREMSKAKPLVSKQGRVFGYQSHGRRGRTSRLELKRRSNRSVLVIVGIGVMSLSFRLKIKTLGTE